MILNDFQPLVAIAPTPFALQTLQPLWQAYPIDLWIPESLQDQVQDQVQGATARVQVYGGSLKEHLPQWWQSRSLVFCLATGAVVRLIAPLLQDKRQDPAVVVVDGTGQFVISLCGGHQGGADRLTGAIAALLHATPVHTGSANALQLPALDTLGEPFGWRQGTGEWTAVSGAIAQGNPIRVIQTAGSTLWQNHLPETHPFQLAPIEAGSEATAVAELRIAATLPMAAEIPTVCWHPRVLWVGVGCERGTPQAVIAAAIAQTLATENLAEGAIAGIATIDRKADEVGLLEFCDARQLPLRCFEAEALRSVVVPNPSAIVAAEVETPSVAEAAALLASSSDTLRVPKQIFRMEGQPGAVTVAIAQAEQETIGRDGEIWLVGMGPGQLDQMTPAAKGAIAQADAVIGYALYIDLIRPCLRPGQIVEALPITQERQRAERAIALAQWGLRVAVVSSGDCGIYGMAGLVFEQLREGGWEGNVPAVQVFPGITALQAAAARVGAPLMHDFCAISLSDLLTPWEQIEKRLTAAAQADFVTALYNPRSRNRVEQLAIAQSIFLQYRDPQTPVAIVQSAYRPTETIIRTTLEGLSEQPVDMLSTVLIGNRTTRFHHQWMITPRGYLGFES